MGLFSFLSPNKIPTFAEALNTDIHSHFLPGIDDGAANMEDSLAMLRRFESFGFQKVVTTPHVLNGHFSNTPEIVLSKLAELRQAAKDAKIDLRIDAAAEYFFDDYFINLLDTNQPLLTFSGSRYVLFETPALNKPIKLEDIIREIQNKDIFPVLAHPERYAWLNGNWDKVKALFDTGVLFQVNVMSLTGLYDGAAKRMAERLIDNQMLHFLGSDCHKLAHTATYLEAMKTKHYRKALDQDLLNRSI